MKNTNEKDEQKKTQLESLDAVIAAPEHHKIIFENERVRVLDAVANPGEIVPVHTHQWAGVAYTIKPGDFIRYDGDGNIIFDSRMLSLNIEAGSVAWLPPSSPHSVENIGTGEMRMIVVELKD